MPAIKKAAKVKSEVFTRMEQASSAALENRDCSVKAVAIVCGVSYEAARVTLAAIGRKNGQGVTNSVIYAALRRYGFDTKHVPIPAMIDKYPKGHRDVLKSVTTHHMARFPQAWKNGKTYLLFTSGHVAAVVDGVNCDWTVGQAKRAVKILEVITKVEA